MQEVAQDHPRWLERTNSMTFKNGRRFKQQKALANLNMTPHRYVSRGFVEPRGPSTRHELRHPAPIASMEQSSSHFPVGLCTPRNKQHIPR